MTVHSRDAGAEAPWGLADVFISLVFIAAVTALLFGGIFLLRPFISKQTVQLLGLAAAGLAEVTMLLAVWLFGVRKYRLAWSALGFRSFDPALGMLLVMVILGLSFSVNLIYVQIISFLGLESLRPSPILPQFLTGIWRLVVTLVLAAGVAPLVEETFFRGFLFTALKNRFGFWLAAFGSAALFALVHAQANVLLPVFVLGILLAWLFHRTGSLWPCIVFHLVNNSLALVAAYFFEVSTSSI